MQPYKYQNASPVYAYLCLSPLAQWPFVLQRLISPDRERGVTRETTLAARGNGGKQCNKVNAVIQRVVGVFLPLPLSLSVGLKPFGGKSLKLKTSNLDVAESYLEGPGLRKP